MHFSKTIVSKLISSSVILISFSYLAPGCANIAEKEGLLFVGDFECGSLAGFEFSGSSSTKLVASPVRNGNYSAFSQISRGVGFRAEIVPVNIVSFKERTYPHYEKEYWYRLSTFMPPNYLNDNCPESFLQFHGVPDRFFLEKYRSPPLSVDIVEGNYYVRSRWDHHLITSSNDNDKRYDGQEHVNIGKVEPDAGVWVDWVFSICWSYRNSGNGHTKIWKDGILVYERKGPNCFYDLRGGPYLKIGMYKWPWKNISNPSPCQVRYRAMYFDDVIIAKDFESLFKDGVQVLSR